MAYAIGLSRGATLAAFSFQAIGLITLSWACAFSLGALSRKTIGANAVLFSIVCLAFGASQGYFAVRFLWTTLYAWFPILVEFVVVLLPAYSGFRRSAKSPNIKFQWIVALAMDTRMGQGHDGQLEPRSAAAHPGAIGRARGQLAVGDGSLAHGCCLDRANVLFARHPFARS
jgi:hypothetical protein